MRRHAKSNRGLMHGRTLTGSFWPSRRQELLLVAALGETHDSAVAWLELRPQFDLDKLERGSYALLPLVYRALERNGGDEVLLPRLKGIYRSTWYKNNLLLERLRESIEALTAADVSVLSIAGLTGALRYYRDVGLRPTPRIELLVEPSAAGTAAVALKCAGWTAGSDSARAAPDEPLTLSDPDGRLCSVRTRLAADFVPRGRREHPAAELWDAAEPFDVRGTHMLVPAPSDELLVACVSGARLGPAPTIQWIADAAQILRAAGGRVDWERLLRLGEEGGQILRLRDALEYLAHVPGTDVPADARRRLDAARATRSERLAHLCSSGSVRGLGALPQALGEHLVVTADRSLARALAEFPRFLRERWQLRHAWQLPLAGGRRAARLLAGRSR